MKIDVETVQARILELEAQLEDAYIKIDLLQEALSDKTDELRACKGQLGVLMVDRRAEVA